MFSATANYIEIFLKKLTNAMDLEDNSISTVANRNTGKDILILNIYALISVYFPVGLSPFPILPIFPGRGTI